MNLAEYSTLCTKIGDFCEYARRRAPFGEVELLERAAALEAVLLEEYNAHGENLALACVELAGSPARVELVARYRQNLAVFGQIRPLIDDLAGGAVSCPENLKARLIWALNGLCSLCSDLSGVCLREFDKIAPQKAGEGKTVPELIEGEPRAHALAVELQKAGYLVEDYQRAEDYRGYFVRLALIGQRLAVLCNCSQSVFEEFWRLKPGRIRKDANAAGACKDVREILKRY